MSEQHFEADLGVIGGGPVGLSVISAAGAYGMKCHVVDILGKVGGQCSNIYPEKVITDVLGIPQITGLGLINNLSAQAAGREPVFHMDQRVEGVDRQGDGSFVIRTSAGVTISCKAVIIAAGNGAISPKKLDLDNTDEFENKSLFYKISDVARFEKTNVMVVGGGDSAADWAIMLSGMVSNMHVVHRRDEFTCMPESWSKLADLSRMNKIKLATGYVVSRLIGEGGVLKAVELQPTVNDREPKIVDVDNLLVFLGLNADIADIAKWGIKTGKFGRIAVNQRDMSTNIPGIFAVGDIADYDGKLKLITTGFSEAYAACRFARDIVKKGEPFHFEYSTNKLETVVF